MLPTELIYSVGSEWLWSQGLQLFELTNAWWCK